MEIKINLIKLILIFTLLCSASKGFLKAFKTFINPFEAPQRSMKIKIKLIFYLRPGSQREGLRMKKSTLFFSFITVDAFTFTVNVLGN